MYDAIQISKINDFIFCPYSLYLHAIYDSFEKKVYQDIPQIRGTIKHKNIDTDKYTTSKHVLEGMPVYSEKYNLVGKIDLYDKKKKHLIERKFKVNQIYDGYRYQLYAQMLCLEEIGYKVQRMYVHSLSDNKRYEIQKPSTKELLEFEELIGQIKLFDPRNQPQFISAKKCKNCIYNQLCEYKQC